jgi:hypothetical protein
MKNETKGRADRPSKAAKQATMARKQARQWKHSQRQIEAR